MVKAPTSIKLTEEIDSILDAIYADILIADAQGVVLKVSPTFEQVYGIRKEDAIGLNVLELEAAGYFKPSITSIVLNTKERVTMRQKNNKNRDIVVTATPVKDSAGNIKFVISFSRDITDFLHLQEQYSQLENKIVRYEKELEKLRSQSLETDGMIAKSTAIQKVLDIANRIAPFDANVLLTGESGVGKTMLAKMIHKKSKRTCGPFIDINCGAIPENLLESELFGYESGSFTGAGKNGKLGLIELAQNGTLFLDEIAELPFNLQAKVLKVIQEKKLLRVGGTEEIHVDFRLIAASNKNLEEMMTAKLFREDLYYRLNVISILIPPLRQRREDIIPMILYFVHQFNEHYDLHKTIPGQVLDELEHYSWPGNVRQLENVIERMILTSEEAIIGQSALPDFIKFKTEDIALQSNRSMTESLEMLEGQMVRKAYQECGTTIGVAALLGISQPTAVRKIQKYVKKVADATR